ILCRDPTCSGVRGARMARVPGNARCASASRKMSCGSCGLTGCAKCARGCVCEGASDQRSCCTRCPGGPDPALNQREQTCRFFRGGGGGGM
uniref:Metallothionein n=1 Tax=Suricata suricatta TaxID=37032 RepID=A0A673UGP0_SURSU